MTHPYNSVDIAHLLAIMPLRLRMIPVESIVLMLEDHDDRPILAYRSRITVNGGEPERVAALARHAGADHARLVLLTERELTPALVTLDRFADALTAADIGIASTVHVTRLDIGAPWVDLLGDDNRSGTVQVAPDGVLCAAYDTSDTIEALYTTLGPEIDSRRAESISAAPHFVQDSIAALQWVLDRGGEPDDALIASIGIIAARHPRARAAVLAVGLTDLPTATHLFGAFAQRLRGTRRVAMLALAATLATFDTHTTQACVALTAAYDYAATDDSVSCDWLRLLDTALFNTTQPQVLRETLKRAAGEVEHLLPDPHQRLVRLAEDYHIEDEEFDEYVHDVFSRRGSDVNNAGLSEQIEFLVGALGATETLDIIKTLAEASKTTTSH